ncbi:MAG: hypothetical protein AAF415_19220 [Pseudomonadota bacterium]
MSIRTLSETAWRDHPLNRLKGGMIAVLVWASMQLLFAIAVAGGLAFFGTGWLFREGVPDAYEWLLWGAMVAGPLLIVPAMLRKNPLTPALYAAYIGVTFLLLLGAEFYALDWFSASRYEVDGGWIGAAIFALAVTIDLIVIFYLFRGARPNVIFRRRELT